MDHNIPENDPDRDVLERILSAGDDSPTLQALIKRVQCLEERLPVIVDGLIQRIYELEVAIGHAPDFAEAARQWVHPESECPVCAEADADFEQSQADIKANLEKENEKFLKRLGLSDPETK